MNKEEILKASRKENKNKDLAEIEVMYQAGSHASRVGALACCLVSLLSSMLAHTMLYSPWIIYFCEVSLENTKQIPSYPKTRGYTKGYALRYFFISAFIFSLAAVTARPTDCWLQCSIFPISL